MYVIGTGKSVQRQAKALEDILGDRLTAGDPADFAKMRFSFWQPIDLYQMVEGARAAAEKLGAWRRAFEEQGCCCGGDGFRRHRRPRHAVDRRRIYDTAHTAR
jgi:hypothetical protein